MPYLTLGDPDLNMSVEIAAAMLRGGADILELGIPFSDPTADGPVIQKAMVRAMSSDGFSMDAVFETAARIHALQPETPLVFLTYLNPVLSGAASSSGDERESAFHFFERSAASGIRGLVIPDLPCDSREAKLLARYGAMTGVEITGMIAPNTSPKRMKEIADSARGFIYYVTSHGVTGERQELPADLIGRLELVRKLSSMPVFAGFGISRPEQAAMLVGHVDGIIAGSVHHRIIEEDPQTAAAKIEQLTREFTASLRKEH
jgi:tryptophan synthase alpha chain